MLPARLLLLLSLALAGLAVASPAQAEVTRKKAMWGPLLTNDFKPTWPLYADLGVGIQQQYLVWKDVAERRPANPRDPGDPAYTWPRSLDDSIDAAGKYGIEILLMVRQSPEWANGGSEKHFDGPVDLNDYADFLEAAARRYPGIRHWMIWGEPTRTTGLAPPNLGFPSEQEGLRIRSRYYARMLDAAYGRLKKVSRSNLVIGGNSYDQNAGAPGFIPARRWVRKLKLPNGKPPRLDMYGHNPFSSRSPSLKQKPRRDANGRDLMGADFADLDTLHKDVNRFMRRKRGKKIKIFVSEYTLQTERNSNVFNFFVSERRQAKWIRDALRIVRRSKWIYSFGYFRLNDSRAASANDNSFPLWGLMSNDLSRRKPAYDAFKNG